MSIRSFIAALPDDLSLTLVDVGSAGGLNPRWRPFAPVTSAILFDPREAEAKGRIGRGGTRIFPTALGAKAGEATLYETALPNMSSFLRPNHTLLGRYWKKGGHAQVTRERNISVQPLDELSAREGFEPHVLKIDTQGSEMLVLEGAQAALSSILLAEIEVSFFERYSGQPLFTDIEAYMRHRDFDLIELHRLKRYRRANSLGIRNVGLGRGQRAGRIAYGDAIFMRRGIPAASALDKGFSLMRAIIGLLAYGKADLAARLFDEGRSTLPAAQARRLEKALGSFRKSRLGAAHLHAGLDWLARKA